MIVGEVINSRYDIKMLIGDGGMANVYLAYDRILRKNVAIKMLRYELSKDESFIKRFNREAMQVTKLEHPNVVKSYAVGEYNDQPFIVMEYIKGRTLKDFLREYGSITSEEAVHIMTQICQGVDQAHHQGIIHRDLKSQNIMIDDDLNVKIADFGIALSSNEADMTQTNTIMGSVHYLAPELARGNLATAASDIYSLGILLYELLTGTVPFKGEGAVNIALQHMESAMPSVLEVDELLPENFDLIIGKATAKKPALRYPDVLEMIEDLRLVHIEGAIDAPAVEELEETMILDPLDGDEFMMEERERMPRKSEKRFSPLSLLNGLAYTFIIIAAAVIYYRLVIYPTRFESLHAVIPDLIGMNETEARNTLADEGFEYVYIDVREVANSDIPNGEVFRTHPAENVRVRLVEDVTIIIFIATDETSAHPVDFLVAEARD
ncbi:MAG: protein kinase [Turicibacter sp.]|nr:protein kinase [Turicibacter sp.]